MSSIDTIKIGIKIVQEEINFDGWIKMQSDWIDDQSEHLIGTTFKRNIPLPNGSMIKLQYIPLDYKLRISNLLLAEFSLPKILTGENFNEIENWEASFNSATEIIASIPGLPKLPNISDWLLYRIDFCHNYSVGENVSSYIEALRNGYFPHRKRMPYNPNGVLFSSVKIICE